jgi:hypothetical protein
MTVKTSLTKFVGKGQNRISDEKLGAEVQPE